MLKQVQHDFDILTLRQTGKKIAAGQQASGLMSRLV
jgi:hypothetical protein